MRKLVTVLLFGFFLGMSAGVQQAQAQSVTFCFTNSSSSVIWVRMFSGNRNWVWPATGSWVLNDRLRRCATLSCTPGEHICYGAGNGAGGNWGVGYDNNYSCPDCCATCDNSQYGWNLTD